MMTQSEAPNIVSEGDGPLTLWGARTGNCLRAAIGLEEAGIPYVARHVELRRLEHQQPPHLSRNPRGKVPVLTGEAFGRPISLTQSNAILLFADQAAPGRLLPPPESPERLIAIDRYFFFVTDVIAISGAMSLLTQDRLIDGARALSARATEAAEFAERFAASGPFLAGKTFSLVDIVAFTIITAMANQLNWPALPALDDWRQRIAQRPSVQRGWHAFGGHP